MLEAIYIGSRLKTFKPTPIPNLIQHNQKFLKLLLNVAKSTEKHQLSIEKSLTSHNIAKNNSKMIGAKELAKLFPVLSLAFGQENIINLPSENRRNLLDWGLFHVKQDYLALLQTYQKCLKQRNYLLKKGTDDDLAYWTDKLSESGEKISNERIEHFTNIKTSFDKFVELAGANVNKPHSDISNVQLSYYPGWKTDVPLHETIANNTHKDRAIGFTQFGPHKADILIEAKTLDLKKIGSMSSQVLASLLLTLAQADVFHVEHGYRPILLIDDLFFGIDDTNLMLMVELLIQAETQSFLTAPDIYKEKLVDISRKTEQIQLFSLDSDGIKSIDK